MRAGHGHLLCGLGYWRFFRTKVQKEKPPLGLHRRGFWNFRSSYVSTYLLRALDGALGTSTTRTTGTTPTEMTTATIAIARAMNSSKAWASKKGMVVETETSERGMIRNESGRKHNPFDNKAIACRLCSRRQAARPPSGQCVRNQCSCGFHGISFQEPERQNVNREGVPNN